MKSFKHLAKAHFSQPFFRWKADLCELFSGISKIKSYTAFVDWFSGESGRRWERDFGGEIGPSDTKYSIFLGLLCMIPALFILMVSDEPEWKRLAQFFSVPLAIVIHAFLMSSIIFLGSHVNKRPKNFSVAFKLMLRVMAIYPPLVFLNGSPWFSVIGILFLGFFVIRAVGKTYSFAFRNIVLFFGAIYLMFTLLQIQSNLNPRPPNPIERYQKFKPSDR